MHTLIAAAAADLSTKTYLGLGIIFIGVCLACVAFVNSTIKRGPVKRFVVGAFVLIMVGASFIAVPR